MGSIIVFFVGGVFSLAVLIWQFINTLYAVVGFLSGIQLISIVDGLVKSNAAYCFQCEPFALPLLGAVFCISALLLVGGLESWVFITVAVCMVFFAILGLVFGREPVNFLISLVYFLFMPMVLKKLTFPIIMWSDDGDMRVMCLLKTIFLAIASGPAVVTAVAEIMFFIDGDRRAAEGFALHIFAPALYLWVLFANFKRNGNI